MFGFKKSNKKKMSMRRNMNLDNNIQSQILNTNKVENTLREGDDGKDVKKLQNMLMSIVHIYPDIPIVNLDGKYNAETRNAVGCFQRLIGLKDTGIVDRLTWERLNLIYSKKHQIKGIEKISVSNQVENNRVDNKGLDMSTNVIKEESKGRYVFRLQEYLRRVAEVNVNIPSIKLDGIFGPETKNAVMEFQKEFGINVTGIVDEETWNKLYEEYTR